MRTRPAEGGGATGPRAQPELDPGSRALLSLVRGSAAELTRADVAERTGWGRTTVQARLERLLQAALLVEVPPAPGLRGRPATRYRFNADRGVLLVADVGASGARAALCDLAGAVRSRRELTFDVAKGPEPVLSDIVTAFDALLPPQSRADLLWGVALSLPGPVEIASGRVVSPPIMSGWDLYDVPRRLHADLGPVPVFVDNDATAMAWGEHRATYPHVRDLIFIKVGTGVGAGIVANGQPLRGAQGTAGDIGHTWGDPGGVRTDRPLCRCGKDGCVEAYVGGWAIARDLRAQGIDASTTGDVIRLLRGGNPVAVKLVRDAGRILGAAVADAVSMFNPSVVVVGGDLGAVGEHLLSGIRERVAARALPLATRDLVIAPTPLAGDSGVLGLAGLLGERVLAGGDPGEEAVGAPATSG